jgi:hypothetical protein
MELIMLMIAEFLPLLDPRFLGQIIRLVCSDLGSTPLGRLLLSAGGVKWPGRNPVARASLQS